MTNRRLHEFYESHRRRAAPLVLATVYATEGSTYSKSGARMLIDEDGIYAGMLSGGCVEGDLAIRARVALDSGVPQDVSFELDAEGDDLWGLGVGCDGVMRILLQRIDADSGYQPYATIAAIEQGRAAARQLTVVSSTEATPASGDTVIISENGDLLLEAAAFSSELYEFMSMANGMKDVSVGDAEVRILIEDVHPDRRLLVLGAGRDAEPVVRFAAELGWRVTIADHRPAYIHGNEFGDAVEKLCCPADELHSRVDADSFDAAIVMSHHLASDRRYLQQLAGSSVAYVGLLGPAARRNRLLDEIAAGNDDFAQRVRGPVGLDLGGRGPGAIALSIVAELQQVFASR